MKRIIEVKLFGLNELGVQEINEYYRHNFEAGHISKLWSIGDCKHIKKKRFKQMKTFYRDGIKSYISYIDLKQYLPENRYGGGFFSLQLKHFKHEIYEVEINETFKKLDN